MVINQATITSSKARISETKTDQQVEMLKVKAIARL